MARPRFTGPQRGSSPRPAPSLCGGLDLGRQGPRPGSAWAGAGETGRALGLRLGGGGAGGLCWLGAKSREAPGEWARAPEGGRSMGGGGMLPVRGTAGAALERGGGGGGACIARCRAMSIHGRAAWDCIPNSPRRSPFWGGLRGGGAGGCCVHPPMRGGGGGAPVGAPSGMAVKTRSRVWVGYVKGMARVWQGYGTSMAGEWQGHVKGMARVWQAYGTSMARVWQEYRKGMAGV